MTKRGLPPGDGLVRRSSGEQAAAYIRRLIFDGELKAGERVPQDQIAETLGISRIPVREALIALEREGWVTIELHRGAFVDAIDEHTVRDHYEMYGLIYGFAVRRALARADAELARRISVLERAVEESEPGELSRRSLEFHTAIVEAARSPRIGVVLRAMPGMVPGGFFDEVPMAVAIQKRGIAAITRAIRKGDADKAAAEYVQLMTRVGDRVVEVFRSRSLFGPTAAA